MIELILVRHGETDSNKKGTYLGWTDAELNENGIRQAYCVKEKLAGSAIDLIYSSPLKRALKTAEIVNENFGLGIGKACELMERNFGRWDDLTHSEITGRFADEYDLYIKDWINYCITGGESALQAYDRVTGFIDRLLSVKKAGRILIVTHFGCIGHITAHLLGMGIDGAWRFRPDNCGIARIEVNDEGYAYLTQLNG